MGLTVFFKTTLLKPFHLIKTKIKTALILNLQNAFYNILPQRFIAHHPSLFLLTSIIVSLIGTSKKKPRFSKYQENVSSLTNGNRISSEVPTKKTCIHIEIHIQGRREA